MNRLIIAGSQWPAGQLWQVGRLYSLIRPSVCQRTFSGNVQCVPWVKHFNFFLNFFYMLGICCIKLQPSGFNILCQILFAFITQDDWSWQLIDCACINVLIVFELGSEMTMVLDYILSCTTPTWPHPIVGKSWCQVGIRGCYAGYLRRKEFLIFTPLT
jgi:hypothetical protein